MKYIRIPMDRLGVLIGPQGKTKQLIEKKIDTPLDIDSTLGEIQFNEQTLQDPLLSFKIENLIRAIGRGFTPEQALTLLNDDMELSILDIHDYVGKRKSQVQRVKSRIIGKHGKTRKYLEHLTNSHISIYGHTVSIIASIFEIDVIKKAIDKLLSGSKHATVYQFIEKQMKQLRMEQAYNGF